MYYICQWWEVWARVSCVVRRRQINMYLNYHCKRIVLVVYVSYVHIYIDYRLYHQQHRHHTLYEGWRRESFTWYWATIIVQLRSVQVTSKAHK